MNCFRDSGQMSLPTNLRIRSSSLSQKKRQDRHSALDKRTLSELEDSHRRRAYSSSASDLAARRGVFSRKNYGSVELLSSTEGEGKTPTIVRFRVEPGERDFEEPPCSPLNSPVHLENPEFQTRWYFKYFLGKLHQNYVGVDSEKEPFLLSVVVTDANNLNVPQYRAILWRKTGAHRLCLPYHPSKAQTVKGILSLFDCKKVERGPKEIYDPQIQRELLVLEEQEGSVNFKFGVLYAKEGQTTDEQFYCNEHGSPAFEKFVNLLGDRVKLKGWDKYKAGLDIKTNTTGEYSVYTVYEGHEIMFHVSTYLPHSKDNRQQVERKRHVGNDIVNIVFYDCDPNKIAAFNPNLMKTRFTHIFAIVNYLPCTDSYRLNVYSQDTVPLFGPPLPSPPLFHNHNEFRDFLLVKLINGEKAAINNPLFAQKRERTLDMLIRNLYQEYLPEISRNNMLSRRAFSDVIHDATAFNRKEETRKVDFVRVGQTLKLKTILKGDAPTSLANTGQFKRQPWQPQEFFVDFPCKVNCGDSWGDKLVVASDIGTVIIEEGAPPRTIFDKTVCIKQLSVIEPHGLMVFRADKGKDGKVYVFRLTDFEGEQNEHIVRSKLECKDHRIERTKGCQLYALNRPNDNHFRMVVGIGRRLLLFVWKHSLAKRTWCPVEDIDVVEGFTFIRELQSFETPQIITLLDGMRGDNQICVGYKDQFDIINEKNGDVLQLFTADGTKVNLVSALDIYEDDEAELILTYNRTSHFQKLIEEITHEFDFHWNFEPQTIVSAFPYILAFTPDTLEIRLIVNGNLVQSLTLPDLTLITAKFDIYFTSTAALCHSPTDRTKERNYSPPPSPSSKQNESVNIFKIPLLCLVGHMSGDKTVHSPTQPPQPALLAPLGNEDRSSKRSPFLRSKVGHFALKENDRHGSSSSDSGISMAKTGEFSPPTSPLQISVFEDHDQETDLI